MNPVRSSPIALAPSVRTYRGAYEAHSHEHAQVLVGLRGSLELDVEGRPAFVDRSCGLVIPAGSAHGYLAQSAARVLVVDCEAAKGTDRLRRFALSPTWQTDGGPVAVDRLLSELVGARTLQPRRRLDIDAMAAKVDAELCRCWTVSELAALCRFSPQRFRARFAEVTGMPPLAWIRRRRLDAAERLLRAGLSLEATALQVGYASASALCFALRRERSVGVRELRATGPIRASLDI